MVETPPTARLPRIFVSGPSRSGTALVRTVLNHHPQIHIASETHYFDHLRTEVGGDRILEPDELNRTIRYFSALTHRPYGHGGVAGDGWLDDDQFRRSLPNDATGDDVFAAFTSVDAARFDAPQSGEKTPRHVFRIDDILTAFPEARMIVTVRDPRAVAASYRSWVNQGGFDLEGDPEHAVELEREAERTAASYHPLIVSTLWRTQMNAGAKARERWGEGRVRLVRYEDLVDDAEREVRDLMSWLDVPYEAEQLDVPVLNSSFEAFDSAGGIHSSGLDRWRKVLPAAEVKVVEQVAGDLLTKLGYERSPEHAGLLAVAGQYATSIPAVARAALANRDRMGSIPKYVVQRARNLLA